MCSVPWPWPLWITGHFLSGGMRMALLCSNFQGLQVIAWVSLSGDRQVCEWMKCSMSRSQRPHFILVWRVQAKVREVFREEGMCGGVWAQKVKAVWSEQSLWAGPCLTVLPLHTLQVPEGRTLPQLHVLFGFLCSCLYCFSQDMCSLFFC